MDKVVTVGILFATFAVGKIFPAGFAINIPLPVNDVVIFIVDEVFPAVGTLLQMFVPAIRAKVNFLPIDLKQFKFFRRSTDVTFHDSLHWLVGCYHHSEAFRRKQGTPSKIPFLTSSSKQLRQLYFYQLTRESEQIKA